MHELSVSSAVVETALRHAGGRRVTAVHLRLGRLRQVVPESLRFYFTIVSRGTDCDGARLELELIDALMGCEFCGQRWDPAPSPEHFADPGGLGATLVLPQFRCPACEGPGSQVLRGDELEVESIDVTDSGPDPGPGPAEPVRRTPASN